MVHFARLHKPVWIGLFFFVWLFIAGNLIEECLENEIGATPDPADYITSFVISIIADPVQSFGVFAFALTMLGFAVLSFLPVDSNFLGALRTAWLPPGVSPPGFYLSPHKDLLKYRL